MKKDAAINAMDRKWRAESDARVLKDHAEITADRSRHAAAKTHLKKEHMAIGKALKGGATRAKKK